MSLLGERLRQAREARGISPLQVEIDTRIRANVVQALEEGDYENLPPEPYLRGIIRSYSNYLRIDSQETLDLYVADSTPVAPPQPQLEHPLIPEKPPAATPQITELTGAPAPMPPPITSAAPPKPSQAQSSIAPTAPLVPPPPEKLAPPEKLEYAQPASEPSAVPAFLAHITRRGIPFPVELLIGAAIVLACVAGMILIVTQAGPAVISLARTGTPPPGALGTRTPTLRPGAPPTPIPTLAVTAAPFATFPGNPTATLSAPLVRTPGTTTGLNLDVSVTQTITIEVGIDGAMAFTGQMQPGDSRSWRAKDSLYVHVVNPRGATILFNGNAKWFGARTFAERTELERMWTLNDKGTPISVTPVAPAAAPSATPPSAIPSLPQATPSPTLTPFS